MFTLSDFLDTDHYRQWESSTFDINQAYIDDPELARRLESGAENGCDGRTHFEVMECQREALCDLRKLDQGFDDDYETDIDNGVITEEDYDSIDLEIDGVYNRHKKASTLDQEIG